MMESNAHIKSIIDDARKLAVDKEKFNYLFEDMDSFFEEEFQMRICEWFTFFNQNHKSIPGIYDQLIFTLFDLCADNELFRTQTTKERELSFELFRSFLSLQIFKEQIEYNPALYLVNISLFYGRYPHFKKRSSNSGIDLLKGKLTLEKMEALFATLFIAHETPHFLTHNLPSLNLKEYEFLDFLLRGNAIHNFPNSPFHLSREEALFFYSTLGQEIEIHKQVLERSVFITKIIAHNKSLENAPNFFSRFSKTFDGKFDLMIRDVEFWSTAYNKISDLHPPLDLHAMITYIDYLGSQKYVNGVDFNLDAITYESIEPKIQLWKEAEMVVHREMTKKYKYS